MRAAHSIRASRASSPEPSELHVADDPGLPIVGAAMASLVRDLRVFAGHDETLLLNGATGTGKSRLARWLHGISTRAAGPFEVVELNTVPAQLQQAELFGWRRGAFTSASSNHDGAVCRAAGGTLFIDEINKLDLQAQAALLRLLEDGRYRPIGGNQDLCAEVRFIVGSNVSLEQAVERGAFLVDLYYRINVLPVRLPALAERRDEIPGWARFMIERRAEESKHRCIPRLDDDALAPLLVHPWPGNLRQLDNVLRRAFALALVERSEQFPGATGDLVIARPQIERALGMDNGSCADMLEPPTLAALRHAASAVVQEALARARMGGYLDIDNVASAFRALVMLEAHDHSVSTEQAFEALGKTSLVQSRNSGRALRNARAQVEALREHLGWDG